MIHREMHRAFDVAADELAEQAWCGVIEHLRAFAIGGKCLRGSLIAESARMFGMSDLTCAYKVGAAMEIAHSGLLIHDDIIDRDAMRRGREALHVQYAHRDWREPGHTGESLAICAGAIAYFIAMRVMTAAPSQVISVWSAEMARVGVANMQDIALSMQESPATIEEIFTMYRGKTARYTFSLPLVLGALLAGRDDLRDELFEIGELAGLAFQLRDDWLGVFGDPEKTGKPCGSDIREGKRTYLAEVARQRGIDVTVDLSTGRLREVLMPAGNEVLLQIESIVKRTNERIGQLPIEEEDRAMLRDTVAYCAFRDR
jgi:geranylgeranyl diphosphate synthase type I